MYSINCENCLIKKKCQKMTILNDSFYFCTVKKIIRRKNYELFIFLKKLFCYKSHLFLTSFRLILKWVICMILKFYTSLLNSAELPLFVIFYSTVTVTFFIIWWIEIRKSVYFLLFDGRCSKKKGTVVPYRYRTIISNLSIFFKSVTLLFSHFRLLLFDGNVYIIHSYDRNSNRNLMCRFLQKKVLVLN